MNKYPHNTRYLEHLIVIELLKRLAEVDVEEYPDYLREPRREEWIYQITTKKVGRLPGHPTSS